MPKFEIISEVRITAVDLVEAETLQDAVVLVKQTSKEPFKSIVEDHEIIQLTEVESFDSAFIDQFGVQDPRYLAELEKEFVLTRN